MHQIKTNQVVVRVGYIMPDKSNTAVNLKEASVISCLQHTTLSLLDADAVNVTVCHQL